MENITIRSKLVKGNMSKENVKNYFYAMSDRPDVVIKFVPEIIIPENQVRASIMLCEDLNPVELIISEEMFNEYSNDRIKLALLHEIGHLKHGPAVNLIEGEFLAEFWALNKVHEMQDFYLIKEVSNVFYGWGDPENRNEIPESYLYSYNKAVEWGILEKKWSKNGNLIPNDNYKGHFMGKLFEISYLKNFGLENKDE